MLWLLIVLFVAVAAVLYYERFKLCYKLRKISGPFAWPIIGNLLNIPKIEETCEYLSYLHDTFGKTFKVYFGIEIAIFTTDTNLIEKIVTSQTLTKKSREYFTVKDWWGDGLLTSSGAKWRSRRKILTPAFHYSILEDFVDVFNKHGQSLIENFEEHLNVNSVDVSKIYPLYTLDVICESSMGMSIFAQKNPQHEFFQGIRAMALMGFKRTLHPLFRYDPFYIYFGTYAEDKKTIKFLNDFAINIIKNRREKISEPNFFENKLNKKKSFLDILLTSVDDEGNPLSNLDIKDEVNTFLFEGFDTTSVALNYLTYNLSIYPEIQKKCYEEIKEVSSESNKLTLDKLKDLNYTEMVIKESLRLYPSVPILGRTIVEEFVYDGCIFPKDVIVALNVWKVGRDKEVFKNPDEFIPERFTPENRSKYTPFDYIPFSAGPRNCIGQRFAMLEVKTAISKILLNFEIKPAIPEFKPQFVPAGTIQPLNGVHVRLERRSNE